MLCILCANLFAMHSSQNCKQRRVNTTLSFEKEKSLFDLTAIKIIELKKGINDLILCCVRHEFEIDSIVTDISGSLTPIQFDFVILSQSALNSSLFGWEKKSMQPYCHEHLNIDR